MSGSPKFVHLRLHTEYSLLEGAIRLKKLPSHCERAGMPAVAVTDTNNLFAALEFSVSALSAGIQPIVGCQMSLMYEDAAPGEKAVAPAPVVLLAQNRAGYESLMKLNSAMYLKEADYLHITLENLSENAEGLICLTGGSDGPVGRLIRAGHRAKAEALMTRLSTLAEVGYAFLELPKFWLAFGLIVMAIWKALLVALYYMHLRFEPKRLWVLAASPLPLAVILVIAVLTEF